jgi:hypothetical protein
MKTNNRYWDLSFEDIEVHVIEQLMLFRHAWGEKRFSDAAKHERELSLLMDALAAWERGGNE